MAKTINQKLRDLIKRNKQLDDALWVLSRTDAQFFIKLDKYLGDLSKLLVGRIIDKDQIERVVDEALEDFAREMKKFSSKKFKINLSQRGALVKSIEQQYKAQVNTVIKSIENGQIQRRAFSQLQVESQTAIDAKRVELDARLKSIRLQSGGKLVLQQTVDETWAELTKQYGDHDKVTFTNGTKFPLTSYVDGRLETTEAEVHRMTTAFDASKNGVLTGRVSSTGSKDSCMFHEGEIVFFSEQGKKLFKKQNPEVSVSRFRTVPELEGDNTHIFKFRCKHTVTPWPIQFFSESDLETEVKDNPIQTIPKNPEKAARKIVEREAA